MRHKYKLLKDTPCLKAGATLLEDCEDGTQGFTCDSPEFIAIPAPYGLSYGYHRAAIVDNPEWFEEIKPLWVPANLYDKVMEFFKTL